MNQLFVYYESHKVGVLQRDQDLVFSFRYTDEWLKRADHFPLSLTLKLENKKFGNKETLSFFENLLPEGDTKASIEKSQDIHGVFDFLSKYGQDCAGAITITTDENYKAPLAKQERVVLEEAKIYQALEEKRSVAEVIADENPGYLSLAGAQDKFPALYDGKKFYLPKHGAPTTHIVKMPIYRHQIKDSVYNELYCMRLAQRVGFHVPVCSIHVGEFPLFVVTRYDRQTDEKGIVHRLHQQDFCQAQGITSEFKYEHSGGPSIKNNFELIMKNTSAKKRVESINILLDWVFFNLLIGNNDSHSKNLSFLLLGQRYEIAPLYDLVCTAIYPKLQKHFAFSIGGQNDYTQIGKKELKLLDRQLEFKEGTCQERMQAMHQKITQHKSTNREQIAKEYGKISLLERIEEIIEARARTFANQKAIDIKS